MRFDIVTIFPTIFDSYFAETILSRAQKQGLIKIKTHDLRQWTEDNHKSVDDSPYGGGPGMVMMVEPIFKAVEEIKSLSCHSGRSEAESRNPETWIPDQVRDDKKEKNTIKQRVILFSAKGKPYTQADARRLAQYEQIIMICGRYEGVDERVAEHIADEELSVGNFVLTGGEIPAMIVVDTVARLVPGVLGKEESLAQESFSENPPQPSPVSSTGQALKGGSSPSPLEPVLNSIQEGARGDFYLEYPQYTRPEDFKGWKVPGVLLTGNHAEIKKWREEQSKITNNFKF